MPTYFRRASLSAWSSLSLALMVSRFLLAFASTSKAPMNLRLAAWSWAWADCFCFHLLLALMCASLFCSAVKTARFPYLVTCLRAF